MDWQGSSGRVRLACPHAEMFRREGKLTARASSKSTAAVGDPSVPSQAPRSGFWRPSISAALPSLRELVRYELYAAFTGLLLAFIFLYLVVFSSLSFFPRLFFVCVSPVYFPLLFSANAAVLAVLSAVSRNISRLEAVLSRVADAVTSRVLPELPSASISLEDLRDRLMSSGNAVKADERSVDNSRGPVGIASRALLGAAVKAVLYAFEMRYSRELGVGGRMLNVSTVKSILTGELAGLLMSPFSASLQLYTICVVAEFAFFSCAPFLFLMLLSPSASNSDNSGLL